MYVRAHTVVSYIDDAIMLHVGHTGSFKIPGTIRHFSLRACPIKLGSGTQKCQPCCVAVQRLQFERFSPFLVSLLLR